VTNDAPAQAGGARAANPVVVVGSGLAGWGVLRELRRLDPELALVLVSDDSADFYSKPGLSTALAKAKTAAELVTMSGDVMAAGQKVQLMKETSVSHIDLANKVLQTSRGPVAYSKLVLALGAEPIRIRLDGDAADEAAPVNHLAEYADFRRRLERGERVAIIGAGLVGCEFANDLTATGAKAVVIDPLSHALPTMTPPPVGTALREALSKQGVEWRLGQAVTAIEHANGALRVTLSDGGDLAADVVVSAVGLRPRTGLARESGLEVRRGVVVDATGRTSDPDVYALGDCAEYTIGLCQFVTPIMGAARAIAASVAKEATDIKFAALSVVVKTTAYPIALLRPPEGAKGEWTELERDADGLKMGFTSETGELEGYILTDNKVVQRVDMDRAITKAA
jgi:rubredoxin---NAD+ reductase